MQTAPLAPITLDSISLREAERGFVLGGSGTGKSFAADYIGQEFVRRYRERKARRLILDSKPRYRAEWLTNGLKASRRYRRWSHGAAIPDSVLVEDPRELERAFAMHSTVIAQGERSGDVPLLVACAYEFVQSSNRRRPQLLQVDELLDFYHQNGAPRVLIRRDDPLARAVRAGRERGTACLYCSQRTKGIPAQVMQELSKCYLFRLDNVEDAKRLQEMGAPPALRPFYPRGPRAGEELDDRLFMYWTKLDRRQVWGPYTIDV